MLPELIEPITYSEFGVLAARASDSAPGGDGIPYSAWAVAPSVAMETLYEIYCGCCEGELNIPASFNEFLLVFIPKGQEYTEEGIVQAAPNELRPLCFSNTDQKHIARALNVSLARLAQRRVAPQQLGFVKGRLMTEAIIGMEGTLYRYAQCSPASMPCGVFLDQAAAFSSISRQWMIRVLWLMGAHEWLVSGVLGLYTGGSAAFVLGGSTRRSLVLGAGIRQGCPASGSLWALAFDPIVVMLVDILGDEGFVRAFADDFGLALRDVREQLPLVFNLFAKVKKACGLGLNVGKTQVKLALMSTRLKVEQRLWIEHLESDGAMLVERMPEWKEHSICGYLSDMLQKVGSVAGGLPHPEVVGLRGWQAKLVAHLMADNGKLVRSELRRKLGHHGLHCGESDLDAMATELVGNIYRLSNLGPRHLQFSMIRAVVNGWCTASRFGASGSRCWMGCPEPAADSLSHYLVCGSMQVALLRAGNLPWGGSCGGRRRALGPLPRTWTTPNY